MDCTGITSRGHATGRVKRLMTYSLFSRIARGVEACSRYEDPWGVNFAMGVIDVGGNIGLANRFLEREFGDKIKQHIGVEPIKENAELFKVNNKKVDLRLAGVAKDARTKTITMAIPSSGYQWYRCASVEHFPGKQYEQRIAPALSFSSHRILTVFYTFERQCDNYRFRSHFRTICLHNREMD